MLWGSRSVQKPNLKALFPLENLQEKPNPGSSRLRIAGPKKKTGSVSVPKFICSSTKQTSQFKLKKDFRSERREKLKPSSTHIRKLVMPREFHFKLEERSAKRNELRAHQSTSKPKSVPPTVHTSISKRKLTEPVEFRFRCEERVKHRHTTTPILVLKHSSVRKPSRDIMFDALGLKKRRSSI